MPKYELTLKQVQNLKALIMDANIKGSAASVVVGLLICLDSPVEDSKANDLHGEHNDSEGHGKDLA